MFSNKAGDPEEIVQTVRIIRLMLINGSQIKSFKMKEVKAELLYRVDVPLLVWVWKTKTHLNFKSCAEYVQKKK